MPSQPQTSETLLPFHRKSRLRRAFPVRPERSADGFGSSNLYALRHDDAETPEPEPRRQISSITVNDPLHGGVRDKPPSAQGSRHDVEVIHLEAIRCSAWVVAARNQHDDMASTGDTLAQAARLLLQDGAASVDVAVTHALIDAEALAALHAAGAGEFWSTDCVAHPTNAVAMAVALARGGAVVGLEG